MASGIYEITVKDDQAKVNNELKDPGRPIEYDITLLLFGGVIGTVIGLSMGLLLSIFLGVIL